MTQQLPETRTVHLRRTYLVRRVQEYSLEIPAAYDVAEWMANDLAGLDRFTCSEGTLIAEGHAFVDGADDDFDLDEVPPGEWCPSSAAATELAHLVALILQATGHDPCDPLHHDAFDLRVDAPCTRCHRTRPTATLADDGTGAPVRTCVVCAGW